MGPRLFPEFLYLPGPVLRFSAKTFCRDLRKSQARVEGESLEENRRRLVTDLRLLLKVITGRRASLEITSSNSILVKDDAR